MASIQGLGYIEKHGTKNKCFLMRIIIRYTAEESRKLGKSSKRISKASSATTKRGAEKELRAFHEVVSFALHSLEDVSLIDERIREVESLAATMPQGETLASWAEKRRIEDERKAQSQTFEQFAKTWRAYRAESGQLAQSTIENERVVTERLFRYLGDVPLEDITSTIIKSAYSSMRADGVSDDGVLRCHKKLKQILNAAVAESLEDDTRPTLHNPITKELVPTPKVTKKQERSSLDLPSVVYLSGILDELGDSDPRAIGVRIGLASGLRIGEVMGLTWGAIDLLGGTLTVKQQYTQYKTISTPKTQNSVRTIHLDPDTVSHLLAFKEHQRAYLSELGIFQNDTTPVVNNERGGHFDPCNYRRWFKQFCVKHGFGIMTYEDGEPVSFTEYNEDGSRVDGNGKDKDGKPYSRVNPKPKKRAHYDGLVFHELRHTFASHMLSAGVDIVTVQKHLGHSKPSTTLDMYSHSLPGNDEKAASLWGAMMAGKNISSVSA